MLSNSSVNFADALIVDSIVVVGANRGGKAERRRRTVQRNCVLWDFLYKGSKQASLSTHTMSHGVGGIILLPRETIQ